VSDLLPTRMNAMSPMRPHVGCRGRPDGHRVHFLLLRRSFERAPGEESVLVYDHVDEAANSMLTASPMRTTRVMAIAQRCMAACSVAAVDASPRDYVLCNFPFRSHEDRPSPHVVLCAATSREGDAALRSFFYNHVTDRLPRHAGASSVPSSTSEGFEIGVRRPRFRSMRVGCALPLTIDYFPEWLEMPFREGTIRTRRESRGAVCATDRERL